MATTRRMTRTEADHVAILVVEYHKFHTAWNRGEVRKAVEAARQIKRVADVARHCGVSITFPMEIVRRADAAGFA